ncbi:hypothetical protein O3P69_012343 [Scylla paramamosain]|uniref:Uncharacterized protein n=1 Tax=Scylla paramamosain TaxID=85552 RepID=A0AAW0SGV7_SCYPA
MHKRELYPGGKEEGYPMGGTQSLICSWQKLERAAPSTHSSKHVNKTRAHHNAAHACVRTYMLLCDASRLCCCVGQEKPYTPMGSAVFIPLGCQTVIAVAPSLGKTMCGAQAVCPH